MLTETGFCDLLAPGLTESFFIISTPTQLRGVMHQND